MTTGNPFSRCYAVTAWMPRPYSQLFSINLYLQKTVIVTAAPPMICRIVLKFCSFCSRPPKEQLVWKFSGLNRKFDMNLPRTNPIWIPKNLTSRGAATGIGIIAILFWSALALLTKMAGQVPPFQLLFLSFFIAFVSSLPFIIIRGAKSLSLISQNPQVLIFSFLAIFTYHALYFYALSHAPAAEASLIAYLWPLLIVIFSIFLERRNFRASHLIGAMLGFSGCVIAVLGQGSSQYSSSDYKGYVAALICALIWSIYSVGNRRFSDVPSEIIGGVCGLVAAAALPIHLLTEETVYPAAVEWFAIVFLGIGPTGLAFFAWDHATKRGNIATIGALAYLAPLVSTLLLIASGLTSPHWTILSAALLTVFGAVTATLDPRKLLNRIYKHDGA